MPARHSFTGLCNSGKGIYKADRWMVYYTSSYNSNLSVNCSGTGGPQITNTSAGIGYIYLRYYVEGADLYTLRGKKVSIPYSIGGVSTYELKTIATNQTSRQLINQYLSIPASGSITINYIKSEIVDSSAISSTISRFVTPFHPRSYADELCACRRYYQKMDSFLAMAYKKCRSDVFY